MRPPEFIASVKKMLGTDKCDQMRGTYSPQRRSNKPWKALFIWTLDVSCVNAWALWKKSTGPKVITTASRLEFQQRLVEELLGVQPGGGECKQPVESCGSDVERELEVIENSASEAGDPSTR
jgi:hypothetical protein